MNYKVVFNPSIESRVDAFEQDFETLAEANAACDAIANYTLMLHDCSLMPDFSNYGLVMQLDEDGDWMEVDEDEDF